MSYDRSVNIALEIRPTDIQEQYRFVPAPLEKLPDKNPGGGLGNGQGGGDKK